LGQSNLDAAAKLYLTQKADGVFAHLINEAAFFDKVELAIWGVGRRKILSSVSLGPSIPIGGSNRPYARSVSGKYRLTANPFELRYGRVKTWPDLSPFRLIAHSESLPLTGIQLSGIAQSILRKDFKSHVRLVELTFDTELYSLPYLRMHFRTRSSKLVEFQDSRGWETLYIGSRLSPWQVRIYQKTESVVRLEYILRRPFLRARGILSCEDLLKLRNLDLSELVSFQEFNRARLDARLNGTPSFWGKELFARRPPRWPLQTLATILRWRAGVDPSTVLQKPEGDNLLGRMQRNLLW
jgi:hypothetical protein